MDIMCNAGTCLRCRPFIVQYECCYRRLPGPGARFRGAIARSPLLESAGREETLIRSARILRMIGPVTLFCSARLSVLMTESGVPASLRNCDFVSQVALIGLVRLNLRMGIVAGARYWITGPDEAEITFMVADDYQKQGIGTAMLNHLCSIARQAGLKRLYALAIADNEGALRLLNKLEFPCDVRSDPAQRMMHITVHLTGAANSRGRFAPAQPTHHTIET